jgi:hypothetical protein
MTKNNIQMTHQRNGRLAPLGGGVSANPPPPAPLITLKQIPPSPKQRQNHNSVLHHVVHYVRERQRLRPPHSLRCLLPLIRRPTFHPASPPGPRCAIHRHRGVVLVVVVVIVVVVVVVVVVAVVVPPAAELPHLFVLFLFGGVSGKGVGIEGLGNE